MSTLKVGDIKHESFTGTTQLKLDSAGNIGINTATPSTPDGSNADNSLNGTVLTVYGDSPAINLTSSTTGTSDYSLINFGRTGSSSNPYRAVIGYKQSDDILRINANNNIAFDTGGNINTGERMRIHSSGIVTVGDSGGSAYGGQMVVSTATGGVLTCADTGSGERLRLEGGSGIGRIGTDSNHDLVFITNGTSNERMRIDSSGKIGINTTSPVGKLTVDENNASEHFQLRNTTNTSNFSALGVDSSFNLRIYTNGTNERMRIDSAGAVEIKSDDGNDALTITPTSSASTSLILKTWQDNANGRHWAIRNRYNQHGRLEFMRGTSNSGTPLSTTMSLEGANVTVVGSLSKGSGSFKIDHPLSSKTNTHHLVHSFIEGPQADLIYRGKVDLVGGIATVNIDTVVGMSDGTFVLLNREVQCFTSNETGWIAVKGSVSGNVLTITSQDNSCTDTISWMVVGERKDPHMYDTEWTDTNGKVILEPLKETEVSLGGG